MNENSASAFNYWDDFRPFTSKIFSDLNVTWHRLIFVWKEKIRTIFKTNSIDLTWIYNWLGFYANDGENAVRQQHQTLKAVTDGKLLTSNVLGQYLSLKNFCRKPTNLTFDLWFGTNVEQGMLLQITARKIVVAPEILKMFNLFWIVSCYLHR